MKILILNGPNLNLLGERETSIYGNVSFDAYFSQLKDKYATLVLQSFQSNHEGDIIDMLHEVGFSYHGIILNAGGYTHTSVSIADAVRAIETQVIEVHISNTLARETFRHQSLIAPFCKGSIIGLGLVSYDLALDYFLMKRN